MIVFTTTPRRGNLEMNNRKLAKAFLQLSQAFATIHEALLEQPPVSEAQVRTDAVAAQPAQVDPAQAAQAAQAAQTTAAAAVDQFPAFADQLKAVLQTVPPGALNVRLGQMIEHYAPGAGAPGQGGIRKIPAERYGDFLAEVRQAAQALGGAQ